MDLDPECHHQVEKKYLSEEDRKAEKFCQPNKANRLRKRSEFLDLRKDCHTFYEDSVIINIKRNLNNIQKYEITVTKKTGNAIRRNYIKRIFRAIIQKNWMKIKNPVIFEIIPKKQIKNYSFDKIEKDILKVLHKRISKIIEK